MDERQRVQGDEAKGPPETDPRIEGEKHPVAKMIGIGVLASLVGIAITLLIDWFPEDASSAADKIDTVYDVLLICSVPIFVLVMTIAIYSWSASAPSRATWATAPRSTATRGSRSSG